MESPHLSWQRCLHLHDLVSIEKNPFENWIGKIDYSTSKSYTINVENIKKKNINI